MALAVQYRAWLAANGHSCDEVRFTGTSIDGVVVDTPVASTWPSSVDIPAEAELPSAADAPTVLDRARIEALMPYILLCIQLAQQAGFEPLPADMTDCMLVSVSRIGSATLSETQAGLLLAQARDELITEGGTWQDVLDIAASL
jgi:hypothetical protein